MAKYELLSCGTGDRGVEFVGHPFLWSAKLDAHMRLRSGLADYCSITRGRGDIIWRQEHSANGKTASKTAPQVTENKGGDV